MQQGASTADASGQELELEVLMHTVVRVGVQACERRFRVWCPGALTQQYYTTALPIQASIKQARELGIPLHQVGWWAGGLVGLLEG